MPFSAWQACEFIGMPEARIILSQAATYVACAPKSNAAYLAIDAAAKDVRESKTVEVPAHLQDTHYKGAKRLGRGQGYQYAHDYDEGYVPQDYGVPRGTYYRPSGRGRSPRARRRCRRPGSRARRRCRASSPRQRAGP